jgi:hypothetical protein
MFIVRMIIIITRIILFAWWITSECSLVEDNIRNPMWITSESSLVEEKKKMTRPGGWLMAKRRHARQQGELIPCGHLVGDTIQTLHIWNTSENPLWITTLNDENKPDYNIRKPIMWITSEILIRITTWGGQHHQRRPTKILTVK